MDDIPLIIALSQCVMFLSLDMNIKADVTLSINTSQYMGSNDYYTHVGKTVQLKCIFSTEARSMVIYKETLSNEDLLVENEKLVASVADQDKKYSYNSSAGKEHNLTIYRLTKSDSSNYRCRGCLNWICKLRGWFAFRFSEGSVYLDVKDAHDNSTLPDFCELVNKNIHGIFFIGHDLKIRCPTNVTIETEPSIQTKIEYESLNHGSIFNLSLVIKNLTEQFNNTRLSCLYPQSNNFDERKDYCRRLPNITVFNELLVTLSSDKNEVTNGGNVSFTCQSEPFLPFAVQWDKMNNDITFGNVAIWNTSCDSRLTITNIDFRNSTSSSLTVFCNVTIGSVSRSDNASVQYDSPDVEFTTSPVPELSKTLSTNTPNMAPDTTNIAADIGKYSKLSTYTTNMAPDTTNMAADIGKYSKQSSFIFPVIGVVVIMILGVVILIFFYNKVRKPRKEHGRGHTHDQKTQNTGNGEAECHNSRDKKKVQLGLTKIDSEVADNVAYMSFETVQ